MSETREIYIVGGWFLSCLSKFYPVGVLEVYIHFQETVREKGIQRRTYEGVDLTPKVMKYNTPWDNGVSYIDGDFYSGTFVSSSDGVVMSETVNEQCIVSNK